VGCGRTPDPEAAVPGQHQSGNLCSGLKEPRHTGRCGRGIRDQLLCSFGSASLAGESRSKELHAEKTLAVLRGLSTIALLPRLRPSDAIIISLESNDLAEL